MGWGREEQVGNEWGNAMGKVESDLPLFLSFPWSSWRNGVEGK